MKKRKYILILLVILFYCSNPSLAEDTELRFGSVAMDIPTVMHRRLTPLTQYLQKELNRPVKLMLSPNMSQAIDSIISERVDISYLTPVAYVKAHRDGNARLVAKMVTNGNSSFRLMIVVKQDSDIKSVEQLVGKTFAFGDKAALLQRAVVVNSGIQLEEFKDFLFLGHYDNIARGVMSGDFDAGILKDTLAYKWEEQGLRIIYSSPPLPPYNIVVNKSIDEKSYQMIKKAFLKLDPNNPEHLPVIKSMDRKYTGFATTSDMEYDVIRKLIRPFE